MLEQSFAHDNQQTGARPTGRDLQVTPSQANMNMNLGVGSPCSTYPLFAGYVLRLLRKRRKFDLER
jgi:hypothetical protein